MRYEFQCNTRLQNDHKCESVSCLETIGLFLHMHVGNLADWLGRHGPFFLICGVCDGVCGGCATGISSGIRVLDASCLLVTILFPVGEVLFGRWGVHDKTTAGLASVS